MKDFRRRLEFRLALEHETAMVRPALEVAPHACPRCGAAMPPRRFRRGRKAKWCPDCREAASRARVARAQAAWRRRHRQVPA